MFVDCPEMELLKRNVMRSGDVQECFVLTLDDKEESRAAEAHILQWLAGRGLGHSDCHLGDSI